MKRYLVIIMTLIATKTMYGGETLKEEAINEIELYKSDNVVMRVESRPPFADSEIKAVYTADAPVIDGTLGDTAWQAADEVTGFILTGTKDLAAAQSHVKLLYDDNNLYIGCKFDEPFMDGLKAKHDQHDLNIFEDDCLELLLDTTGLADTFYHFAINSLGAVYDSRAGDVRWSSKNISAKGAKSDNCWTLEVALPFADLEASPSSGDIWGIKLCRERKTATDVEKDSAVPRQHVAHNKYQDFARLSFSRVSTKQDVISLNRIDDQQPLPGYNVFSLEIINNGRASQRCDVELKGIDKLGLVLSKVDRSVELNPSGKEMLAMPFTINDDSLNALVITLHNADNSVFLKKKYPALINPDARKLKDIEQLVAKLEANFSLQLPAGNPLVKSAYRSVAKIRGVMNEFRNKVEQAIKGKRSIKPQEWNDFQAQINGFYRWYLKYRILCWHPDVWTRHLPTDFPNVKSDKLSLEMKMAGNEIEQSGLSLSGLALAEPLQVQIFIDRLELQREDGHECLQPDDLKIYEIVSIRDQMKRLTDDPLAERSGNIFTIIPGKSTHLWIEVWARSIVKRRPVTGEETEVLPGKYSGTILIRPLDVLESPVETWIKVPVSVEVRPFGLPDTKDMPLDVFVFTTSVIHKTLVPQVNMVRDLHKHKINWVMCDWWRLMPHAISKWKDFNEENLKEYTGLNNNDEMLKEAKRLGMKVMYGWNNTGNPFVCARVAEHMQELGFDYNEFASQGNDEFGHEHVPHKLDFHKRMMKLDPNMQFMETYTSVPPPYGATADDIAALSPRTKIWVNHMARFWPPTDKQKRMNLEQMRVLQKKHGNIIGVYQCAQGMRSLPIVDYYRLYPWKAWALGVEMISYWTYISWEFGSADTFNTLQHAQEGFVHYGNGGTLVSTKRYEAFREGLEDYCYLHLLKTGIERAKGKGRDVHDSEAALDQAVKDALRAERMQDFDVIRDTLAAAIVKLEMKTTIP